MVTGGAEETNTPLGVDGFGTVRALFTRNNSPQVASRPWGKERDGSVLGDGADMVALEEYEYAKVCSAEVHVEVVGFGTSSDTYYMTPPPENGAGVTLAMVNALRDAATKAGRIGHVNVHGTSTFIGDKAKIQAVKPVFGDAASRVVASSTKPMTGHLSGVADAVESIFPILALRD